MDDEELLIDALRKMDELVDDVFEAINDVADQNDFEREWVIEKFREKFNRAKKELN